jgi:hypothetical protein
MFHQTCQVNPLDSKCTGLNSREPHRTCPVYRTCTVWDQITEPYLPDSKEPHRTCPVWDQLLEALRWTPERSAGPVRWPQQTCPMESLLTALFVVGAINRPPPTPWGRRPLSKHEKLPWDSFLELSPLSLRFTLDSCSWEKIWALLSVPCSSKSTSSSPLTTSLYLLLLGIESPRWLGLPGSSQGLWWSPESLYCPPLYRNW